MRCHCSASCRLLPALVMTPLLLLFSVLLVSFVVELLGCDKSGADFTSASTCFSRHRRIEFKTFASQQDKKKKIKKIKMKTKKRRKKEHINLCTCTHQSLKVFVGRRAQ